MPTLREIQSAFAAHLLTAADAPTSFVVDAAIPAAARLAVYRHNSRSFFDAALRSTYPVIERRVGTDYFKQLSAQYRDAHPSARGDLHWVGAHFPRFLAQHLADTPYAWLTELAQLEWAVAAAAVAPESERIGVDALRNVAPDSLGAVRLQLIPSLAVIEASVPVLAVWRANRDQASSVPIDLALGGECVVVHRAASDDVELRRVSAEECRFVRALHDGQSLEEALEQSALAIEALQQALARLFGDGCVAAIIG